MVDARLAKLLTDPGDDGRQINDSRMKIWDAGQEWRVVGLRQPSEPMWTPWRNYYETVTAHILWYIRMHRALIVRI